MTRSRTVFFLSRIWFLWCCCCVAQLKSNNASKPRYYYTINNNILAVAYPTSKIENGWSCYRIRLCNNNMHNNMNVENATMLLVMIWMERRKLYLYTPTTIENSLQSFHFLQYHIFIYYHTSEADVGFRLICIRYILYGYRFQLNWNLQWN